MKPPPSTIANPETGETVALGEPSIAPDAEEHGDLEPSMVEPETGPLEGPVATDRYTLRRRIGHGAMGEVHLFKDMRIGRDVAMKIMLSQHRSDAEARTRFVREARVQGQLEHPAIVPVHDLGVDPEGSVFFTMKFLRGMTLAQIIRGIKNNEFEIVQRFPRRKLLTAFSALCLAVDFAHSRGVLHRDLKPANVMLGDFGEVYLLDWGIAKLRSKGEGVGGAEGGGMALADLASTLDGRILGTFGYMSPEQAAGKIEQLDGRSDVYSLGAILFEALTLEPLHRKGEWTTMVAETTKGVIAKASERAPDRDIPLELDAICIRATAVESADRFGSARELHEAIERFLDGDSNVEMRRRVASEHARAAEEAAWDAITGGESAEKARRSALLEVGRALALDPTNAAAMQALVKVIATAPREVPVEVGAEMAATAAARDRLLLIYGIGAELVAIGLIVPGMLWMGLVNTRPVIAMVALTVAASALKLAALRSKRSASLQVYAYAAYVCNLLSIVASGRVFGPLLYTPMALAVFTFAYAMSSKARLSKAIVGTACLALVVSVALERFGVFSKSYEFQDGIMTLLPNTVRMPELATVITLMLSSIFMIIVPGLMAERMQRSLREAEKRSLLQQWHLRQLLPEAAPSPTTDPPDA